ncbi:MAG: beta-glucosidase BglX [Melioribacteraceae bacterium]|nr:beta-glucosidase BglX [Melioribacteraceae bacterium]
MFSRNNNILKVLPIITVVLLNVLNAQELHKKAAIEDRVNDLIVRMTLSEKIGQMQQSQMRGNKDNLRNAVRNGLIGSFLNAGDLEDKLEFQKIAVEESRLGIPLIYGRDVIHGYKTVFPIPLGQAATWHPELVETAASVAAAEASEAGIHWTFAPMVDISRDPRWGRIAESCGEDPLLASKMGAAMVRGFQGKSLADQNTIAACAKHYAGYGAAESGKDYNTTWIPERLLRDVYLVPFKGCVDAGTATLMSAFNDLNGIPASGNEFTLKTVLRDEWNFNGYVVSDWASITEMIAHGFAADEYEAAFKAAKSGVNMEMVTRSYANNLEKLVEDRKISEEWIDELVKGILRIKFKLGLFDNPFRLVTDNPETLSDKFRETAKKISVESLVLLQNNNMLPLADNIKTLAVIGPLADDAESQLGTWVPDGNPEDAVTPLAALREYAGNKINVLYSRGMETTRTKSKDGFDDAVETAERADAVIMFCGEDALLSGESHSRAYINLPGVQTDLIKAVARTGKPIALIIMAGRPLTFGEIKDDVNSILFAWHPGIMGGPAVVDVLFGKASPSGKLPVSFPRTVGQVPIYYSHKNTGRPPSEDQLGIEPGTPEDPKGFVSYFLDVDYTPAYPFGYGLSYTDFEYSDLKLSKHEIKMGDSLEISVTVSNTGSYAGEEVVQLYVRDLVGSVTRPVKELKSFKRINLLPGESKEVKFVLNTDDLKFWDINMNYTAEPGDFKLWVGGSSDAELETMFELE